MKVETSQLLGNRNLTQDGDKSITLFKVSATSASSTTADFKPILLKKTSV